MLLKKVTILVEAKPESKHIITKACDILGRLNRHGHYKRNQQHPLLPKLSIIILSASYLFDYL